MAKEKPHHHGNLRTALIEAGIRIVNQDGPEALSIRKLAAKIGVSHAAPAHHFPSLAHLRTALIAQGHARFAAAMQAARRQADPSPRAQALAAALGYLRFARRNPGLFNLMFGSARPHDFDDPDLQTQSCLSRDILSDIARPFADSAAGALGTELLIWSIAHGFARLSLGGEPALAQDAQAEAILSAIFPDLPLKADLQTP